MVGYLSSGKSKCRSHAELDSASHETLNQVQGDGAMSVRAESRTRQRLLERFNYTLSRSKVH